jgi:hypothetical protein
MHMPGVTAYIDVLTDSVLVSFEKFARLQPGQAAESRPLAIAQRANSMKMKNWVLVDTNYF